MSTKQEIQWETSCLLLGAGFSVEMQMPLVWDLTKELKDYLTPEKLTEVNRAGTFPSEVCNLYAELHGDPALHYEQIIRAIQDARNRSRDRQNPYLGLATHITWLVNQILYLRHKARGKLMARCAVWYKGLKAIAASARPLWVFSLNHDLCTEMICDAHAIPWTNGVADGRIEFAESNRPGARRIAFNRVKRTDFFAQGGAFRRDGVNLVKLHGALDLFIYDDRKEMLYLPPDDRLVALEMVYERAQYLDERGEPLRAFAEFTVSDLAGEMQFLQPTLLSGNKFSEELDQHAPREFLPFFARKLEDFETIVSIGYSFGDAHIDQIILKWLDGGPGRRVVVVDPRGGLPASLTPAQTQVSLVPQTAVDFLLEQGGSSLDYAERFIRRLSALLRDPRRRTLSVRALLEGIDVPARIEALLRKIWAMKNSGIIRDEMTDAEMHQVTEQLQAESEREYDFFLSQVEAATSEDE